MRAKNKKIITSMIIATFIFNMTALTSKALMPINVDKNINYDISYIDDYNLTDNIIDEAIIVSKYGNDSTATGDIIKPFKTIQAALNKAKSGSTILIKEGTYNEKLTVKSSGSKDGYINIQNYPNEKVVLDGTGVSGSAMVNLNGQSFVRIEGIEIINNKTTSSNKFVYGFLLNNKETNIIIKNNTIKNIVNSKPKDYNYGASAILCYGTNTQNSINNILIEGNTIKDCTTGWSEAVSIDGNCEYVNVINNIVSNTGNIGIDFIGNFGTCANQSLDQARYCIARGNIISKANSPNATSYGLYVDGGRDIILEGNVVFDSQGGIEIGAEEKTNYPTKNITVVNNLVYNNTRNGITVGGYNTSVGTVENVKIYNNTIANNGTSNGEINISMVNGVDIQNNILYSNTTKAIVTNWMTSSYSKNISFDNNVYYTKSSKDSVKFVFNNITRTGFSNWQGIGQDKNSTFDNPLFNDISKNDYSLDEKSIAIDKGNNSINTTEVDLVGNLRINGTIDCGAIENWNEKDIIEPELPEVIPPNPEPPVNPGEEDSSNPNDKVSILPSFNDSRWILVKGYTDKDIKNNASISLTSPISWDGANLWGTDILKPGQDIEVSVKEIGANTAVQIWVDDECILNLREGSNIIKEVTIPLNSRVIDICIVATKANSTIQVDNLIIN